MTQFEPATADPQLEAAQLRDELSLRDQLVQQLSQELFRLVKTNATAAPVVEMPERQAAEMRALREQLQSVEAQVEFYQTEIGQRDREIYQLRQTVQELGDRTKMLEKITQELPQIYRDKFEQRMATVREKVTQIQRENRQLHAELQSVSYRLAVRNRRVSQIDLPSFPRPGAVIPAFGSF